MDLERSRLILTIVWEKMMSKNSVPEVRFKNFEKKWVSYLLSEYSTYRRGSFPQPYGNKEWYDGDNSMPFVQVVDVLENLRLTDDTKQKISTLAQPMSVFVPSNSVIVTLQGSIGRVAITQYDAYVDRTILIFEDYNSQTNKEFWSYTIRNKFEIERQKAPGGTIKTITKEALSDFKVSIPEYTEQSAIGKLFRTLDNLLSSYKDNLTNYQSLKETMLSKMFPKAGQTHPEIRLDGFEEEWERKGLSEVCTINSGRDYKHLKNGDIPVYGTGGYMLSVNEKLSDEDAIGIGRKGTIDKPYLLSAPFWTVDTLFYVICKVGYDLNYLFLIFQKIRWKKFDESTGVPSLSKKTIEKLVSKFPSYEEQRAIGLYFSNLDHLINSYQEKISHLETLKKKLLQDMFI